MNETLTTCMVFLFLAVLVYAPVIWLVCRYVQFRPFIRFLYGLTAVPVFLGLLLINIGIVLQIWPAGAQFLQQANTIRERKEAFLVLVVLCVLPMAGSWLWYRFFAWLNHLTDLDPPQVEQG